jgi:hypothetical protein
VSALFDLAGRERNSRRRTVEEYLKFGATVLDLDENIVFYADPEPAAVIEAERSARGLSDRTVVCTMPFEELRTYDRLARAEEAARGRPIQNANPHKDTPRYRLLTWAKFELLARTIEAPPFRMKRVAWLDFGIGHVAQAGYWPEERPFRRMPRRIRLLRLRPFDEGVIRDRHEYFSFLRGLVGGGLISGGRREVGWLCRRFFREVDRALADGSAPLEEQVLPIIAAKRPRAFEFYAGDYPHILDNYFRPHGSADNLLFQMGIFRQLGDLAGARRLGAEILASRADGCFDADPTTFAALIHELALASA